MYIVPIEQSGSEPLTDVVVSEAAPAFDPSAVEDAIKHGQGLLAKVVERKAELAAELDRAQAESADKAKPNAHADDIERALFAVAGLLTGNLDTINEANAAQLKNWLDTSSLLTATKGSAAAAPLVPSEVVEPMTVAEGPRASDHILVEDQSPTTTTGN